MDSYLRTPRIAIMDAGMSDILAAGRQQAQGKHQITVYEKPIALFGPGAKKHTLA